MASKDNDIANLSIELDRILLTEEDVNKKANELLENHKLPTIELGELKFTTITGAINDFVEQVSLERLTIDEIKSLLLKTLIRYKYSTKVKDFFEYKQVKELSEITDADASEINKFLLNMSEGLNAKEIYAILSLFFLIDIPIGNDLLLKQFTALDMVKIYKFLELKGYKLPSATILQK